MKNDHFCLMPFHVFLTSDDCLEDSGLLSNLVEPLWVVSWTSSCLDFHCFLCIISFTTSVVLFCWQNHHSPRNQTDSHESRILNEYFLISNRAKLAILYTVKGFGLCHVTYRCKLLWKLFVAPQFFLMEIPEKTALNDNHNKERIRIIWTQT